MSQGKQGLNGLTSSCLSAFPSKRFDGVVAQKFVKHFQFGSFYHKYVTIINVNALH